MKKLLTLLSLPLFIFSCGTTEPKAEETTETAEEVEMINSDLANEHMMGQVKSFEETPYTLDADGNMGEMDSCCVVVEEYDSNGFMMKLVKKNMSGETTEMAMMERTEEGKFVSSTRTEGGKVVFKRVVDRSGEILKAMDSDSTGQVTRVHVLEDRNENDQALKGKTYMGDGTTYLGTWTWEYIDGNRVGNTWTDSTGVQTWTSVGEVNDKGWVAKRTQTEVDEEGNSSTKVITYTYDSMDAMGNWTQCTKYEDGEAVEALKRSYAYYEE